MQTRVEYESDCAAVLSTQGRTLWIRSNNPRPIKKVELGIYKVCAHSHIGKAREATGAKFRVQTRVEYESDCAAVLSTQGRTLWIRSNNPRPIKKVELGIYKVCAHSHIGIAREATGAKFRVQTRVEYESDCAAVLSTQGRTLWIRSNNPRPIKKVELGIYKVCAHSHIGKAREATGAKFRVQTRVEYESDCAAVLSTQGRTLWIRSNNPRPIKKVELGIYKGLCAFSYRDSAGSYGGEISCANTCRIRIRLCSCPVYAGENPLDPIQQPKTHKKGRIGHI